MLLTENNDNGSKLKEIEFRNVCKKSNWKLLKVYPSGKTAMVETLINGIAGKVIINWRGHILSIVK